MREDFLQFVWAHRLWQGVSLRLADGRPVEIIDTGILNTGPGPDFFNAKIRLDGCTVAGNVEIHLRASDWHRHGHHSDPAYDSVVLHAVHVYDRQVYRTTGSEIPALQLDINPDMEELYRHITTHSINRLPCARFLRELPQIYLTDWITALAFERLYSKADRCSGIYSRFYKDWGATAFITLARGLGFSTNSAPMEQLAASIPFHYLRRHSDSQEMLEAFIFGQAGLLYPALPAESPEGQYFSRLRQNYEFLAAKYALRVPQGLNWKFSGSRPQSSPWRRLALLARMVAGDFTLASSLGHITSLEQARALFEVPLTGFWATHFSPTRPSDTAMSVLSPSAIDSLVINVVVPLMHAFGVESVNDEAASRSARLLQELPPEDNSLTRMFVMEGVDCPDAFSSQALIHLRRNYCETRKCLYCRIGHRYLASTPHREL